MSTILFRRHNGANPDGYVVDHKNNNNGDNRLKNPQLITQQQNFKRYHTKFHQKRSKKREVKATNRS